MAGGLIDIDNPIFLYDTLSTIRGVVVHAARALCREISKCVLGTNTFYRSVRLVNLHCLPVSTDRLIQIRYRKGTDRLYGFISTTMYV